VIRRKPKAEKSKVPSADVGRYLLPNEHLLRTAHQHWALLIAPLTAALGGVLAATVASTIPHDAKSVPLIVWILAGFLIVRLIFIVANWSAQYVVLTTQRLMLVSGLFNPKITTIALNELKDLTLERSFGGNILGYGAFTIESGGRIHTVIDYVKFPEELYLDLFDMLQNDPSGSIWQ
jgi:hypothetical protein